MKQGGSQVLVAIDLGAGGDDYILGHTQAAQATMRPLRAADGRFMAFADDDHQIDIAIVSRRAPGVRAEEPDLFGLKFGDQSLRGGFEQIGVERFHEWVILRPVPMVGRVGTARMEAMGFMFPDWQTARGNTRARHGVKRHPPSSVGLETLLNPANSQSGGRARF